VKPLAHFVWYGQKFPFMNRVAIESALQHNPSFRVLLWHADPLRGQPDFDALLAHPRFEARELKPELLFPDSAAHALPVKRLREVYVTVRSHVSRSNLARAALCYHEGGIYLDTDVLVLRDLTPLLAHACVLGLEHVIWPQDKVRGLSAYRLLGGPLLGRLRALLARAPRGEQLFDQLHALFQVAVNGAIMGGAPGHAFFAHLLKYTAEVPESEWQKPHRLGTHVLQLALSEFPGHDLTLVPPPAFFPLGPEISRQYFRARGDARSAAARVASPETYLVHWYASVTALNAFGAAEILRDEGRTIFATLCAPVVRAMAPEAQARVSG
jgi:hypothetical protein